MPSSSSARRLLHLGRRRLSSGLSLSGDRTTGTPTAARTSSVAVTARDSQARTTTRTLAVTVRPPGTAAGSTARITNGNRGLRRSGHLWRRPLHHLLGRVDPGLADAAQNPWFWLDFNIDAAIGGQVELGP